VEIISLDRNKVTTPELMEHQKRLFDMLSGEVSSKPETDTGKLRAAKQSGSNDRIDRSPDQIVDDRKLVSLASEFEYYSTSQFEYIVVVSLSI